MKKMDATKLLLVSYFLFSLCGCAAVGTAVSHMDKESNTQMSNSIILPPKKKSKVIYIHITNSTNHQDLNINKKLKESFKEKGWDVSNNLENSNYVVEGNVIQVGKKSMTSAEEMLGSGYGGAFDGFASTAILASSASTGVYGAVGGEVVDNAVKDVNYTLILDLKINVNHNFKEDFKTRLLSTVDQVNLSYKSAKTPLVANTVKAVVGLMS